MCASQINDLCGKMCLDFALALTLRVGLPVLPMEVASGIYPARKKDKNVILGPLPKCALMDEHRQ